MLGEQFSEILRYRGLLGMLAWRDIRVRYKQSLLGVAWAFLMPLINALVIYAIFTFGPVNLSDPSKLHGMPYMLFVLSGIVAWGFFAGTITSSTECLTRNSRLVTKIYFPREVFPLASVAGAFVDFVLAAMVVVPFYLYYTHTGEVEPTARLLLIPFILLIQATLATGLALVLSMANLFFRDVKYITTFILQMWFFATNVFYPINFETYPRLRWMASVNPMIPLIDAYRACLMGDSIPNPIGLAVAAIIAVLVFYFGWKVFHRAEFKFAEYVQTMGEPVIIFDHIYKKFARGEQHTTLRDLIPALISKWWNKKQIDEQALKGEEFWAVNDVSFTVPRGEALGIIGPNGSGKSTILKLLSGILRPDRGTYSVKGRLSALIEVGAGFHPDLTGRENVYLNGSILGMTRKEINSKFNQIVEFAGVEEFIDTPVKRYSSGMAVRLGFAISAFIEPDVLLVDEVLAVGDTEFRNRCSNRMEKMRRDGVTMILVSHNLNEVRNLCEKTVMLFKGQVLMEGPSQKVLEKYHQTMSEKIRAEQDRELAREAVSKSPRQVELTRAELLDDDGIPAETFQTGKSMTLRIHYNAKKRVEHPRVEVEMVWAADDWAAAIFRSNIDDFHMPAIEGAGHIDLRIGPILAEPNVYQFNIQLGDETTPAYDQLQRVRFVIAESLPIPGVFSMPHTWSITNDAQPKRDTGVSGTGVSPVIPARPTGVSPVPPEPEEVEEYAAK